MKKIFSLIITFLLITTGIAVSQSAADSLLNDLDIATEETALLPKKMILSQRVFWGENGLYRKVGIAPKLTLENREKELKIRRTMFKIHQAVGLLTAAGMLAQGFLGARLYKPETYSDNLLKAHRATGMGVNISYATTALMAFTAPPPLINRRGISSSKAHKYLSYVHLTAMIGTNVLGSRIKENFKLKPYHRGFAYTAVGSYMASIIVLKFEF